MYEKPGQETSPGGEETSPLDDGGPMRDGANGAGHHAVLARAAQLLHSTLDLEEVLERLCHEASAALGADVVVVYFGGVQPGLEAVAAHGAADTCVGSRLEPGEGLSGRAFLSDSPQVATPGDPRLKDMEAAGGRPVLAALAVPLRRRGSADGALAVAYLKEREVGETEVRLLEAFADLAGAACRNADDHATAQRAAVIDSLTGCLNHAGFQERLREEISRAERGTEPFSLALLDLDGFKAVNERYGHLTGDTVLRMVGELLRDAVRLHDQAARFGGDEFALLLPATGWDVAERVVARTLESLAAASLPGEGMITASAGLAEWDGAEQATALIERADSALRRAKRERRAGTLKQARRPAGDERPVGSPSLEEQARRLAAVGAMGARLSRILDPDAILELALDELRAELGYEDCSIVRLDPERTMDGEGPVERAILERRPVLVHDADRDPLFAGHLAEGVCSELAVPLYAGAELWGAIDLRAARAGAFSTHDAQLLQNLSDHVGAALRTAELYQDLEQSYVDTAQALAAALEARGDYLTSRAHSISDLAVELGRALELAPDEVRSLRYAAIFHDIGKIAVPETILRKPGELTAEELEVVQRHPVVGEDILAPVPSLADVRAIVRHDHERWDGSGYPDGLRGNEIPIGSRVVFVVDSYRAMLVDRPYRPGLSAADARERISQGAGSQFDPAVVAAFLQILEQRERLET